MIKTANITAARILNEELHEIHLAGGYCHIVTDDYNIEDHHIDFCLKEAIEGEDDIDHKDMREVSILLLCLLRLMSEDERKETLGIHD